MREDQQAKLQHSLPDARSIQYSSSPAFHYDDDEGQRLARRLLLYGALTAFLLIAVPALLFLLRNQIAPFMNVTVPGDVMTGSKQQHISLKEFKDSSLAYSFSYPASWSQEVGEMIDGGCNITFSNPQNDTFWVSVCGLYTNPLESIENLARLHSASGTALVREEMNISGKRAIRQDVVVSGENDYSYTISYFIADVPAKSIGTTSISGILAIHMRISDRMQVNKLKNELDVMMNTFMIEDIDTTNIISPTLPPVNDANLEPPVNY